MADRIPVLFAIPTLNGGGAERVFSTLLANLDRDRFAPELAVGTRKGAAYAIPEDVPVHDFERARIRHACLDYVRLIRRQRPRVVLSTLDHLNLALGLTKPLWPAGSRLAVRPTLIASANTARTNAIARLLLAGADAVILQSPEMEQDFREALRWRRSNTLNLPNPIDVAAVRQAAADQTVDTGFDHDRFNLVAVGRLTDQKGFDLLLPAIASLADPGVALTLIGDGPERAELEAQCAQLGLGRQVRFLGFRSNPFPFIAEADGLVLPSRFEGFPNTVLEALACRTPVVATPVLGLASLFSRIEECQLAGAATVDAIAGALRRFIVRGPTKVADDAVAEYDIPNAVAAYEDVLRRLAG